MNLMHSLVAALASLAALLGSFFTGSSQQLAQLSQDAPQSAQEQAAAQMQGQLEAAAAASTSSTTLSGQHVYTQAELLALAGTKYADGNLPLGDYHYVTNGPKKGYIYLCHANSNSNAGADANGPWIGTDTWNVNQKLHVQGSVSWKNSTFSDVVSGVTRLITGNGLPLSHTTGTYPIASTDPAHQYDKNPNSIKAQSLKYSLPASPTYSATPYCMGGEVGIMFTGVPLFNGFDEPLRDAAAHELQDSCNGHPQASGEYHYHNLPSCLKDTSETTVLGFALDGFPITGPVVGNGRYLTTADLDECHGLTSAITLNGKTVTTYHYVMTYDFPYSTSCFRGKPVTTGPSSAVGQGQGAQSGQQQGQGGTQGGQGQQPPQAALSACSGKASGASCSFSAPNGTVTGTCQTPPGQSLACVPAR